MHCARCEGLMISIRMEELSSAGEVRGWRCLLCGETVDPGIQANRKGHRQPVRSRARVPGSPAARYEKGRV
jgi:hypothetical protein